MSGSNSIIPEDWFTLAEQDLLAARLLLEQGGPLGIAAFHIQQTVEKSLKGYLLSTGWHLKRIHDLETLVQEPAKHDSVFEKFLPACQKITEYYVETRYPFAGASLLTEDEVRVSFAEAKQLLAIIRDKIYK